MSAFMTALLQTSFIMSAVVMLTLALNKAFGGRVSAAFRRRMWLVVLMGLLIPFKPGISLPFEPLRMPETAHSASSVAANRFSPGAESLARTFPSAQVPPSPTVPYSFVLFGVWVTVAASVLIFHLRSYQRFISAVKRWSRDAEATCIPQIMREARTSAAKRTKPVAVKTCALVESPMLIKLLKPTILLPEQNIPEDELECVLKHEFIHYLRGDLWVNVLVLLVLVMHWFNPIVYLMAKIIRADCEAACDETVVAGGTPERRRRYGEAIIGFIGAKNTGSPMLSTYFYGGSKNMKRRLNSIMDTGRKSKWLATLFATVVLSLTVLSGSVFASPSGAVQDDGYIGEDGAKAIALEHAEVAEDQTAFIRVHLDYDDGWADYEVDFYADNTQYEYEIDAVDGSILQYDREVRNRRPRGQSAVPTPTPQAVPNEISDYVGEEKAKSVALSDAGFTEAEVTRMRVKLDRDDGRMVYEVDFNNGRMEYEYEIDAVTGAINEYDAEYDD
ncbi:MAG: PepSY domain-containing protein [Clostridiales bacterium]|jgi:beta-lactamase regulating signal transducer with metallopeptidase domain/uncharacterized membrane protein YkoI|nr:PepSY domain-containing protein [Clostridiales bacterium]